MWTNEGPNLYLTEDKSEVVKEGDPRARFLFCATGSQVTEDEARKYGLIAEKAKLDAPAETKLKAEPPPNKSKG
jgi:hypothetical protein